VEPGHLGHAPHRLALASDTLITVVRARALARHPRPSAADEATPRPGPDLGPATDEQ